MASFADTPFAVLSLIAAPASLTNASSVLIMSTSNRFARTIDRARLLLIQLEADDAKGDPHTPMRLRHLDRTERRATLLLSALSCFYVALGSFAAASLISIVGASLGSENYPGAQFVVMLGGLVVGVVAVGGLVAGCSLLVRETRIGLLNLKEETALIRQEHAKK